MIYDSSAKKISFTEREGWIVVVGVSLPEESEFREDAYYAELTLWTLIPAAMAAMATCCCCCCCCCCWWCCAVNFTWKIVFFNSSG